MKCPFCGFNDTRVIETREFKDGNEIKRRRECPECKRRFTTLEKTINIIKMIVKNDGRREEFNIEKIKKGLFRACEKRPISSEMIDTIVNNIEREITLFPGKEVNSRIIGDLIMEQLKKIDDVAYIRFASVYKQFKDIKEFAEEIKKIKK
jgi:transcriptional repressor NrdR